MAVRSVVFVLLLALSGYASAARPGISATLAEPAVVANDVVMTHISKDFLEQAGLEAHKHPYGNPSTSACMDGEKKVSVTGLPGSFCSPSCSPSSPCPADSWKGATAAGKCVLETPGSSSPTLCALLCKPGAEENDGGCPKSATCQPIQGLGICTYPDSAKAITEGSSSAVAVSAQPLAARKPFPGKVALEMTRLEDVVAAIDARNAIICPTCVQLGNEGINKLVNYIMKFGVLGSCSGLCMQIPNQNIATVCDLVCMVVGIEEFQKLLSKADLDVFYFCELADLCPTVEGGAASLADLKVSPSTGHVGTPFQITSVVTVTAELGAGETVLVVKDPQGEEFGTAKVHDLMKPGTYALSWKLDTSAPEGQPPLPSGAYSLQAAVCQGECGSKHPHSEIYGQAEGSFTLE